MPQKKLSLFRTFKNAFNGIGWILQNERNFQIEVAGLVINLILIFLLRLTASDVVLIMIVCFLVLITEMLNTAAEKICDFIQPKWDKKIGLIKDLAAGAVVLSVVIAVIVGIYVYAPYLKYALYDRIKY